MVTGPHAFAAIALATLAGCFIKPDPPIDALALPGPLDGARMVYDVGRGEVVMYGGNTPDGLSAATWALDATGWVAICDPCEPGRLVGEGLAYDQERGIIVLYGGFDSGGYHDEIWELASGSSIWQRAAPTGTPPIRDDAQMVYDTTNKRMIIVGGQDGSQTAQLDAFSYDGSAWAPLVGAATTWPGVVSDGTAAVYDPAGRVLVATYTDAMRADELWAFDTTTHDWSMVCSTCSGRAQTDATLVWDPSVNTAVMFEGTTDASGRPPGTWQLSSMSRWTQVSTTIPAGRANRAAAYDATTDAIVSYGGFADASPGCDGECDADGCICAETVQLPGATP